jgi:TonB family protein
MRKFPLVSALSLLGLIGSVHAADFRPAVLIQGKTSLVNLIDQDALMKHGQVNAMVHFTTAVSQKGDTRRYWTRVSGGTPNSELLTKEVIGKIDRSFFDPAIYRGTPQTVVIFGTVIFTVVEGKPHLRIYLNQETEDLKRGSDFIAPQLVLLPGTKFKGFEWPQKAAGASAMVGVRMDIDINGKITGMKLEYESRKGMDFGGQAMMNLKDATFLPGFRNGKPVSCSFSMPVHFKGAVFGSQWSPN